MTTTSTLFDKIVTSLGLTEAYYSAVRYYNNTEKLTKMVQDLGITGLLDDGNVLTSSLQSPRNFMAVTDALLEHLNGCMDSIPQADEILAVLLETEVMSADAFVPQLQVLPSAEPGRIDLKSQGVNLVLSVWASPTLTEAEVAEADVETLMDGILDDEEMLQYFAGRLTVTEAGALIWSPNPSITAIDDAPIEPALAGDDLTIPSIPSVDVDRVTSNREEV